jgi:hypothetical protein
MITIRRIYQYLVCFISLQAVAAALNALLGGAIRWLLQSDPADPVFFTLQLAILIVGTPIFLGHWLWARYLARKDPGEAQAFSLRLYLYANQGVFLAYVAIAAYNGVESLASPLVAGGSDDTAAVVFNSILTVLIMGGLWAYHALLSAPWERAAEEGTGRDPRRILYQLHILGWAGVGAMLATPGLAALLIWLFKQFAGSPVADDLTQGLAMLAAGLPLWVFHERRFLAGRRGLDRTGAGLRWLFAAGVGAIGLLVTAGGLFAFQTWAFARLASQAATHAPDALAALISGGLLWAWYERDTRRHGPGGMRLLRWLYAMSFAGLGTLALTGGTFTLLRWAISEGGAGLAGRIFQVPDLAAAGLPGLLVLVYYQRVARGTGPAIDEAQQPEDALWSAARMLRRLYVLAFSGLGVGLTTLGLIGLQENLYAGFRGQGTFTFAAALAWLVVGLPLWLYHWRWAGRLFASPLADERRSDLRKVYFYAIIYLAVNAAIVTTGLLVNGMLRSMMGLPAGGRGGLSLAIILAAAALWAYHARALRRDIAVAGETRLQEGMQRLYWYLVAALGLVSFVVGLSGVLNVFVQWLALRLQANAGLLEQLAGFVAALTAGLPVWLLAWLPAQREARSDRASSRQSILRKVYLYAFLLVAIVATLFNAITVVYHLLNALLGLSDLATALGSIARATGLAVIGVSLWVFHGLVLRGDAQRARQDRQAQDEERTEADAAQARALADRWADFPLAVVDDGDGSFGQLAIEALRRKLPYLSLIPVALTAAAAEALSAPADQAAPRLAGARLIVAPWTALTAGSELSGLQVPAVLVPVSRPGVYWAGLAAGSDQASQIVRAVEQALRDLPPPSTAAGE